MLSVLHRFKVGGMNTTKRFLLAAGLLAGLGLVIVPDAMATSRGTVRGGWLGELPCGLTSVAPSPSTPTTLTFSCASGTTWDGVWAGHTHYVVNGTLDLVTGNASGTIDETLVGVVTASASPGTLHLVGTFDVDGATNTIEVDETLVGGTGAFAASHGHVTFEGVQLSGAAGHGGYHGTWTRA
jgi:hypothetical protein